MTTKKLSVTVATEVAIEVARLAEEDGVSFSSWISDALARAVKVRAGLEAVAEWEAENGAFTEEELAWADEALAPTLRRARAGGPNSDDLAVSA